MSAHDRGDSLDFLLRAEPTAAACESVADWWPGQTALYARHAKPVEAAIAGGFAADRLAWAFCAGYQAALRALVPQLPPDRLISFCVSETGGNHPRAIQTTLSPCAERPGNFLLQGHKRWTSLGPYSALLLVAARSEDGAQSARVNLKLVAVRQGASGVSLQPMPDTAFIPEVAHAEVRFEGVVVSATDLLAGDGYARYVKPFRTLEDLHVHAAMLACLLREARRLAWPRNWAERAFALLHALVAIARLDATAPATHIALAGTMELGAALLAEADTYWDGAGDDAAAGRWRRDRALLTVAAKARAQRLERAWERVGG